MTEAEVEFRSNGTRIAATRCLPDGRVPFPVVLMIHGTGPLDRDENMPGQRLNIFNAVAAALGQDGVASIRYDKRGCGKSDGDYYATSFEELVEDAVNLVDAIALSDWSERVYLLGHSEGCLIASQVAALRPQVAGLVLLCPFITDVETLLGRQARQVSIDVSAVGGLRGIIYRALLSSSPEAHSKLIARLKASTSNSIRFRFRRLEAKALRQLFRLDPESDHEQCLLSDAAGGRRQGSAMRP